MWIKASDRLPESGFRYSRVNGANIPLMFATHVICDVSGNVYKKERVEWFDESASIPLEDVKGLVEVLDKCKYTFDWLNLIGGKGLREHDEMKGRVKEIESALKSFKEKHSI